ncbi:MAG: serine/threonine-protein phosphatase, partial [Planctomycetaceae bacterium]|nr:serine/threonine-protein phosphatase [Planctomycetaceae bacterium]
DARRFQLSLLPPPHDSLPGIAISARYLSCTQLAGDLYDYTTADSQSTAFLIADVVGHGATAAMLTSVVKSAFRSARDSGYEPAAVIERVQQGLQPFDVDRFVTLCCGQVDGTSGRLRYVNAGHPPPLLRTSAGVVNPLEVTGPLLSSAFAGLSYSEAETELKPGDVVLAYTDGVTETPAARDGDWFGSRRLEALVASAGSRGGELLDSVLAALDEFSGSRARPDDVTLLSIEYLGMSPVPGTT